ncbi:MFS transporter [Ottowia sp.]|uniref:MFS transporter n=1 Tax=Ottowia sp. TaxID=1898956 RepID=UPI002C9D8B16|nr:MFS transporter [Ottowia sp.]HRN75090.1 MFS transporter [Ottowia sp.]HRQ03373.1 MFS transporter [Ottowia sp.]
MNSTASSASLGPLEPPAPVPLRDDARVIGLVGLAHASSHFAHLLLPALFPIFMTEFDLSFAQLGFLSTVFFAISGAGQAMSGFLVDRVGARPVLFASFGCFILACLAGYFAQGYGGLMLVAVFAGLGNAPFHPVDFSILNQRVSTARLGYAFSAHGLSGNLGWALTPVFLLFFTAWSGWRSGYLAAAVMYLCILAVLVRHRQHLVTEIVRRPEGVSRRSDVAFLRLPVVWWCFAFFLLSTMTLAVVQNFAPSIMQAMHQVSFEAATTMLTAYMLCGAVGVFVGGFVAARLPDQSDRVVAWAMGIGALLLALAGIGWLGGFGSMAVLSLTGFAVGVGGPSRDMMIKRATPKGATGRVYGTVYSGLDIGFAIAPTLYGVFMDRGMYVTTLMVAALLLLLSVGAALAVGQRADLR